MSVEVLVAARVRGKRRRSRLRHLPGGWSDETRPVNVVLVDHPGGLCLFDTGPGPASGARRLPEWHPWLRLARFEALPTDGVAAALAARGATPRDVRWVVLSHLHVDHVGAVGRFPAAHVIVSGVEWTRAAGVRGRLRGYVPHLWPPGREPTLVEPVPPAVGPFPGSHDVAGDGTLLVVPTPGHTPGHVGLLVLLDGSRVLCGGDLAATFADLERAAPAVASWCAATGVDYVGAHGEGGVSSRSRGVGG